MKKLLSLFLLFFTLHWLFNFEAFAENEDSKNFIVTAYYSPLPDQDYYLKWNYEDELKLNGMWIKWASWKDVFIWMLAAPKNYEFWTKVKLEWLGVWSIEDRWWAIVNAWIRWYTDDRIDVWMWYWDEGLRKALFWWKRKVKWSILSKDSNITLDVNDIPSPIFVKKNLENSTINVTNNLQNSSINLTSTIKKEVIINNLSIFDKYLQKNSNTKDIILLQEKLLELSLYNWELTWKYSDILDILVNYQLSKNIISSENSVWAWCFWPSTRKNMKQDYEKYLVVKKEEEKRKIYLTQKFDELSKISENSVNEIMDSIWQPVFWEVSPWVRELQISLKKLWNFKYNDTAIFWDITRESIVNFQLENNIISSVSDIWSWILWPKTREVLENSLKKQILNTLLSEQNIDTDELVDLLDINI